MTMRPALFRPVSLSLFIAMTASITWWGSTPANAQTTIAASTTVSTSTSSTTTTTSTSANVLIGGVVKGVPESVAFAGLALLNANVVTDPDFGAPPTVVLSIDLSKVAGVGLSTLKKYVTSNQQVLNRGLAAADTVQFTFPFLANGGDVMSALVGKVSFNLRFNVNTLQLTGVTAQLVP